MVSAIPFCAFVLYIYIYIYFFFFYMRDGALAILEDRKIVTSWKFIVNQGNSWKIKENWNVVKENG